MERKSAPFYEMLLSVFGGGESASGEIVTADSAMRSSAVYACVGLIAESVAMLPLKVYRRRADGGRNEARDHWLWGLMNSAPNDWMTPFELREFLLQHLALRGNAYCYKVRDRSGRVRELLPIHPSLCTPKQDSKWAVTYAIQFPDGTSQTVAKEHVWHLRYRTLNGFEGVSPIAYHRDTIGMSIDALKHGARQMRNGARPSGVLTYPGALKKEQIDRLRESWEEHYGGKNAGKTAVLEGGAKFEAVSITNEDLQYLQTREFQVEDIARIYRVPLHMIQNTSKSTSWGSGIESMGIGFVQYTLLPWLRRIEGTVQRDFVPPNERADVYAEFSVNALMRGDVKSRYASYKIGIDEGFLSPNEVRMLENMNPREGGDIYLTPLNMRVGGEEDGSDDEGDEESVSVRTEEP